MQAEDRLIHFSTELIHPPVEHEADTLRKLYFDLSQSRDVAYDSTDFSLPGQFRFYSRRGKRSQSIILFLADRMVLIEEWADIALSDFVDKVKGVAARVLDRSLIAKISVQTATLRSTFALTHFDDARVFLLDHMCAQASRIAPHFQRPVANEVPAVGGRHLIQRDPLVRRPRLDHHETLLAEHEAAVPVATGRQEVGGDDGLEWVVRPHPLLQLVPLRTGEVADLADRDGRSISVS